MNQSNFSRPSFEEALAAWKTLLSQRGVPTDCTWVFDENLCFEKDPAKPGATRLAFQLAFTPIPSDAAGVTYDSFSEGEARLVLYRLGSCRGKSICALLCDEWFETKTEKDGFIRRDEWLMSFRPGGNEELEEITDRQRWKHRLLRDRPRHDLDFCMPLRAVHELMAHGRVLSTYERYAMKFFHVWWRLLGQTRPAPESSKSGAPGHH
jgi:hypothetical protein